MKDKKTLDLFKLSLIQEAMMNTRVECIANTIFLRTEGMSLDEIKKYLNKNLENNYEQLKYDKESYSYWLQRLTEIEELHEKI